MAAAPSAVQPPRPASAPDADRVKSQDGAGVLATSDATSAVVHGLSQRPEYRCACGHRLRVVGVGRHRVYFEPGPDGTEAPVMDRGCPACARDLPGKNPR